MNIKALPSMGQRLFCCFCFVESAVCSTFAERIIRGHFRGCTCLKCTNKARSTPTEQEVHQQSYVGALETSAPPKGTNKARRTPVELRWCT